MQMFIKQCDYKNFFIFVASPQSNFSLNITEKCELWFEFFIKTKNDTNISVLTKIYDFYQL